MPRQPEGRLVGRILTYCRGRQGRWTKVHGGDPYQESGISDILGCYRGRFVAIEVKRPGGKVSPLQQRFLEDVEKAGGYAIVAESVGDVRELLDTISHDIQIES
jgi:hypothetical protein